MPSRSMEEKTLTEKSCISLKMKFRRILWSSKSLIRILYYNQIHIIRQLVVLVDIYILLGVKLLLRMNPEIYLALIKMILVG